MPRIPSGSVLAILVIVAGAVVAILAAPLLPDELARAVYGGAVSVMAAGVIGGLLKLIYDDVAAAARARADSAAFVTNVLADLKGVYDRVERARHLIRAHRSIKTYGQEMRDLIEARVQLKNVVRALENRPRLPSALGKVQEHARRMETYLGRLTDEFETSYKDLSGVQRRYEAKAAADAKAHGEGRETPPLANTPWEELTKLDELQGFLERGSGYREEFVRELDAATKQLREELARILS